MAKSFRNFREESYDSSDWADHDDDIQRKNRKMQSRRDIRRQKTNEKFAAIDEKDDE
jgi:hypothetical protein